MWNKIKETFKIITKILDGKKRRIAIISSGLTTIGGLTGQVWLTVAGTIGTALFGGADGIQAAKKTLEKQKEKRS